MAKAKTIQRPKKPKRDFPLFAHATGRWAKKVRGKFHYFTKWSDDPRGQAALDMWIEQRDDLLAGRTPRAKTNELTLRDLCNRFLSTKKDLVDNGEIVVKTFRGYFATCQNVLAAMGKQRLLTDLAGDDFAHLRQCLAKTRGPVALSGEIARVRMLFKFAYDGMLIDNPVRYGAGFKKPAAKVIWQARVDAGPRMFEAADVRAILQAARVPIRAMVLLGVNCGFGNADVARLPLKAVDLDGGWVDFARPKTAISRRCQLWSETVAALKEAIADRPSPKNADHGKLVFLTNHGQPWARDTAKGSPVTAEFRKLLGELGLHRPGLGFYALRHTFETIAGDSRDQVAVDHIMGHSRNDMASVYRERIDDARLVAVVNHVREWLFSDKKAT